MISRENIIRNFIIESSRDEVDLRWKLGRYIEHGDLSFLGKSISELNMELDKLEEVKKSATITK